MAAATSTNAIKQRGRRRRRRSAGGRKASGVRASATPAATTTRVSRNASFGRLQAGYLFPEIARLRREHQERFPDAKVISLGIGDTTEPVPLPIASAMSGYAG